MKGPPQHLGNYAVRNVDVWNSAGIMAKATLEVRRGRLSFATGSTTNLDTVIDGTGLIALPLGVDPQVHLRYPGQPQKELPATGLTAAIRGGVGALLTMPNTKPVIDDASLLEVARQELLPSEAATGVRVLFSAAVTVGQRGKECVDFESLARAGAAAFTDDGVGVLSDDLMRAAFRGSAETGLPILQHAEMPGHGCVLAAGPVQRELGLSPYPIEAEVDMVARDLRLLKEFGGARYHVLHVSAKATLDLVEAAKAAGLPVTCEVSPHHLLFSSEDIALTNTAFKMNPPLRSKMDRDALRRGLASGLVDFVATDHAPHEREAKGTKFSTAAFGTTGLEATLRVLNTLRREGLIDAKRLVEVFSAAGARFLGISDTYGYIEEGRSARVVLFHADADSRPVEESDLFSHSKNSCFLGAPLNGEIKAALVGADVFDFANVLEGCGR